MERCKEGGALRVQKTSIIFLLNPYIIFCANFFKTCLCFFIVYVDTSCESFKNRCLCKSKNKSDFLFTKMWQTIILANFQVWRFVFVPSVFWNFWPIKTKADNVMSYLRHSLLLMLKYLNYCKLFIPRRKSASSNTVRSIWESYAVKKLLYWRFLFLPGELYFLSLDALIRRSTWAFPY